MSELHLSFFVTETISYDKRSIDISDTLELLYFAKKMSEHRYDIRISESCVDPNPLKFERQDPDNLTRFQTQERCAWEIAAYVFNVPHMFYMCLYRETIKKILSETTMTIWLCIWYVSKFVKIMAIPQGSHSLNKGKQNYLSNSKA